MKTLDRDLLTSEIVERHSLYWYQAAFSALGPRGVSWDQQGWFLNITWIPSSWKGGTMSLFCVNDPCICVHHHTCGRGEIMMTIFSFWTFAGDSWKWPRCRKHWNSGRWKNYWTKKLVWNPCLILYIYIDRFRKIHLKIAWNLHQVSFKCKIDS